jgi:hypothetical protein
MREVFSPIAYMAREDPAAIAGVLLIGISGVLFIHIQLKMLRAGYKTSFTSTRMLFIARGWDTPGQYLKICEKHGWSPWPTYLLAPCILLGVTALIFGLFRL